MHSIHCIKVFAVIANIKYPNKNCLLKFSSIQFSVSLMLNLLAIREAISISPAVPVLCGIKSIFLLINKKCILTLQYCGHSFRNVSIRYVLEMIVNCRTNFNIQIYALVCYPCFGLGTNVYLPTSLELPRVPYC